jgi:two-component system cell cycle response regulator
VQDIPTQKTYSLVGGEVTLITPLGKDVKLIEPPLDQDILPPKASAPVRHDTPVFHTAPPLPTEPRATLTLLTGLHAGQLMAVDGVAVTLGRAPDANLVLDEMGVSRHHARVGRTPAGEFYVEDLNSTNGTFVGASRVGLSLLHRGDVLQLGPHLRLRFAVVDSVEETLYRQLYESSVRDPLTDAFNRKYFVARLLAEVARARRAEADLAVLMIDVDALKRVNDAFGHLAGDKVLCAVAARILRVLRVEDVLARYGGDEYVVLAAGACTFDAERLAERVRRAVEGLHMSARGHEVRITSSIGVASFSELSSDEDPVTALLALADSRMYGAKESGRNKVCAAFIPPREATNSCAAPGRVPPSR